MPGAALVAQEKRLSSGPGTGHQHRRRCAAERHQTQPLPRQSGEQQAANCAPSNTLFKFLGEQPNGKIGIINLMTKGLVSITMLIIYDNFAVLP